MLWLSGELMFEIDSKDMTEREKAGLRYLSSYNEQGTDCREAVKSSAGVEMPCMKELLQSIHNGHSVVYYSEQ